MKKMLGAFCLLECLAGIFLTLAYLTGSFELPSTGENDVMVVFCFLFVDLLFLWGAYILLFRKSKKDMEIDYAEVLKIGNEQKVKKILSPIAIMVGLHIHGLNIGKKPIMAFLCKDKILFRERLMNVWNWKQAEYDMINLTEIKSFSLDTRSEVDGTVTTSTTSGGSSMFITRGNVGSIFTRPSQTVSITRDSVAVHHYCIIETATRQIIIEYFSKSKVPNFISKCESRMEKENGNKQAVDKLYEATAEENDAIMGTEKAYKDAFGLLEDDGERIDVDSMSGPDFERFCADLLRIHGYTDIYLTPASGDHGIDITAEKDSLKWGFQCKRWSDTKIDNATVAQTYTGKALYECDIVAIITTSGFTRQAESEAKQLGVKLWGRNRVKELMQKLEDRERYYFSHVA